MAFKVNEDIEKKVLGEESLILLPSKSEFYKINSTGTRILEGISSGKSVDDVVEDICGEYDIEPGKCRADVKGFVMHLEKKGIIIKC
jgi:hypothetical protein